MSMSVGTPKSSKCSYVVTAGTVLRFDSTSTITLPPNAHTGIIVKVAILTPLSAPPMTLTDVVLNLTTPVSAPGFMPVITGNNSQYEFGLSGAFIYVGSTIQSKTISVFIDGANASYEVEVYVYPVENVPNNGAYFETQYNNVNFNPNYNTWFQTGDFIFTADFYASYSQTEPLYFFNSGYTLAGNTNILPGNNEFGWDYIFPAYNGIGNTEAWTTALTSYPSRQLLSNNTTTPLPASWCNLNFLLRIPANGVPSPSPSSSRARARYSAGRRWR